LLRRHWARPAFEAAEPTIAASALGLYRGVLLPTDLYEEWTVDIHLG